MQPSELDRKILGSAIIKIIHMLTIDEYLAKQEAAMRAATKKIYVPSRIRGANNRYWYRMGYGDAGMKTRRERSHYRHYGDSPSAYIKGWNDRHSLG